MPQELGDFAVLVHGGWDRRRALAFNVLSGSTFLVGGLVAYTVSFTIDVAFLLPLAAGNFIYIAAADLVPATRRDRGQAAALLSLGSFVLGLALLYALAAGRT